jgi:hypothetical protein
MIFIYLAAVLSDCGKIDAKVFGFKSARWFSRI